MEKGNASASQPGLTLSIVSHGDSQKVSRLLESLYFVEPERQFRMILTDNLGEELPDIQARPGDSILILRNKEPQGFSRNHNQAFKRTETDLFCILNPDIIFIQPVFAQLISLLEKPKAAIVSPLITDSRNALQDSFRPLPTPLDIFRRKLPGYRFSPLSADEEGLVQTDWIAGIFMLMKSNTFRTLNGFNEKKFHMYFEDVDLCTRARLLNLKVIVDTHIQIQHDAQRASRKNLVYLLWHLQSAIRFYASDTYKKGMALKRTMQEMGGKAQ